MMFTFHTFETVDDAHAYRKANGSGGWVFASENGLVVLFPHGFTPSRVFDHPFTQHANGKLS